LCYPSLRSNNLTIVPNGGLSSGSKENAKYSIVFKFAGMFDGNVSFEFLCITFPATTTGSDSTIEKIM
jgi:hypothetical protein